jgi:hypothetical protein
MSITFRRSRTLPDDRLPVTRHTKGFQTEAQCRPQRSYAGCARPTDEKLRGRLATQLGLDHGQSLPLEPRLTAT